VVAYHGHKCFNVFALQDNLPVGYRTAYLPEITMPVASDMYCGLRKLTNISLSGLMLHSNCAYVITRPLKKAKNQCCGTGAGTGTERTATFCLAFMHERSCIPVPVPDPT
jgi:hypothetical protein